MGVSPYHIDVLTQSHMYPYARVIKLLEVEAFEQSFLRPSVICQSPVSACMVAMLSSIYLELSMDYSSCNVSVARGNAGVFS